MIGARNLKLFAVSDRDHIYKLCTKQLYVLRVTEMATMRNF